MGGTELAYPLLTGRARWEVDMQGRKRQRLSLILATTAVLAAGTGCDSEFAGRGILRVRSAELLKFPEIPREDRLRDTEIPSVQPGDHPAEIDLFRASDDELREPISGGIQVDITRDIADQVAGAQPRKIKPKKREGNRPYVLSIMLEGKYAVAITLRSVECAPSKTSKRTRCVGTPADDAGIRFTTIVEPKGALKKGKILGFQAWRLDDRAPAREPELLMTYGAGADLPPAK